MKTGEAKEGMRVYENEFGKKGTITHVDNDLLGCDVDFDDGESTWLELEFVEVLED